MKYWQAGLDPFRKEASLRRTGVVSTTREQCLRKLQTACSEDCALIHAQECEVRVKLVQRSVPAHVVKRTEYVDQYIEYILRSECVIQMLI